MKNITPFKKLATAFAGVLLCHAVTPAWAAPVTSLSDITYWVGSGSNQSAVVIQWNDGDAPASVVWGYLWNDENAPTVETLMYDLASQITFTPIGPVTPPVVPPGADSRLSLAVDVYGFGPFITGVSYDQNGLDSGEFTQTIRNQSGFLWTLYELGAGTAWPAGGVLPANFGMSGILLQDEGWYGWAYTDAFPPPDFDPVAFTFDAPVSAVPEPSTGLLVFGASAILLGYRKRHETETRI